MNIIGYYKEWKNYCLFPYVMHLPFPKIRRWFMKCMGATLASNVAILKGIKVFNAHNIYIEENSVINYSVMLDGRGGKLG